MKNRRVVLARVPRGAVREDDFRLEEREAGSPGPGEALLRTLYLSLDPYQRSWMAGAMNYGTPPAPGDLPIARAISEVLDSRADGFLPGDIVLGETGWQSHPVAEAAKLQKVDPALGPISTAVGVLGSPGLTAWVGMHDLCRPAPGMTVVVSAATGAVGSVACQLARMAGARVVGVAGAPEKCRLAESEFGAHACVSHRAADFAAQLAKACPDGVDAYFDNTGGPVTAAVYALLRQDARVALCGLVAEYGEPAAGGPDMRHVLRAQATVTGFSVRRNLHRMDDYRRQASAWIREGRLRYREDITQGLENAPKAFIGLLSGRNVGKCLVEVSPDPTGRAS